MHASTQALGSTKHQSTFDRSALKQFCSHHPQNLRLRFRERVIVCRDCSSAQRNAADWRRGADLGMSDKVLITFDVDGTLMQSTGLHANLLHKKAFSHAFLQVFGVEGTIDAIKVSSLSNSVAETYRIFEFSSIAVDEKGIVE